MKTKQCTLPFPDDILTLQRTKGRQVVDDPLLLVSEIEISYHPAIKPSERITVSTSQEAEKVFRRIWDKPLNIRESFYALFLNRANKLLGYYLVSIGGMTGTVVDVRTIFQAVLKANANQVIFAHNHPSGNRYPSDADIQLTNKLKEAGKILDIAVLDHLIILPDGYYSMADEGIM